MISAAPHPAHAPIAALSTAPYNAAIGVVRVSGTGAHDVAARVFRPDGSSPFLPVRARSARVGVVYGADKAIDRAVVTCWRAPHSYTGEDMAEFSCHGGRVVLTAVLEALLEAGARMAEPGEFTKRAFLNGKLDLAQSEAVIDLIQAESLGAAASAYAQLEGALSARIEQVRALLVDCDADIMAYVDFEQEGVQAPIPEAIQANLQQATAHLDALLATCGRARIVREGAVTVLLGRPNVGKSSLLNALTGRARSIVTELPGTTRDMVEQPLVIGGQLILLQDTAGVRETSHPVERLGVERTVLAASEADLILAVFDSSAPLERADMDVMALCTGRNAIAVCNKVDLNRALDPDTLRAHFSQVLEVSAKTLDGMDALAQAVGALFAPADNRDVLVNLRQADGLRGAREAIERVLAALAEGIEPDIAEIDLRAAIEQLDRITGRSVTEDVLDSIFTRFCVGK